MTSEKQTGDVAPARSTPEEISLNSEELRTDYGIDLNAFLEKSSPSFSHVPIHAWHFANDHGERRSLVFCLPNGYLIPSNAACVVGMFSHDGSLLSHSYFHVGWRVGPVGAEMKSDPKLDCHTLTLKTGNAMGPDITREIYALRKDTFQLLRIEDSAGNLVRNTYRHLHTTIGESFRERHRTKAEWIKMLESKHFADRLEVLNFIAGDHSDPGQLPSDERDRKTIELAQIAKAVRDAPATQRAIEAYRKSDHPWLKQAAEFAATDPDAD